MDVTVKIEVSTELEALLASLADSLNSLAVSAANNAAAAAHAPSRSEEPKKQKATRKKKDPAPEAEQTEPDAPQEQTEPDAPREKPDYAAAHAACKELGVKLVQAQRREELKAVLAEAGASKLSELTDEQAAKVAEALGKLVENDG